MSPTPSALVAFSCGVVLEGACALWVHYAGRGLALRAALVATVIGACNVLGIGAALHAWPSALGYVAGYFAGTFFAVAWSGREAKNGR